MGTLTIRNLDDETKEKLRVRAARHGRSMEAEVRELIAVAVTNPVPESGQDLYSLMRELFAGLGWDGSTLPSRNVPVRFVDFDE